VRIASSLLMLFFFLLFYLIIADFLHLFSTFNTSDTGVLGLVSSPKNAGDVFACKQWMFHLIARGVFVVTSDICDYYSTLR
jgi:hypothetical protein